MRPTGTGHLGYEGGEGYCTAVAFWTSVRCAEDLELPNDTLNQGWRGSSEILDKVADRFATELHHMRLV